MSGEGYNAPIYTMVEALSSAHPVRPRVTIGMPVCNGERFLGQTLDCWLSQNYRDFQLIISDDASTDSTPAICRDYAASDSRIRYVRSELNQGAVWNFNHVFGLADTEFFAWAAQDDWWDSTFLAQCIDVLNRDPRAIGAHPRIRRIDAQSNTYAGPFAGYEALQEDPVERFRCVMSDWLWCFAHYGVWRTKAISATKLYRPVYGPDHVFVAEAALYGKIAEVPEVLWAHRTCNLHETSREYVERVRRGLEPHSKPGSYRFPLASLTREHVRTAVSAPFALSVRLRLLWSVVSVLWVHQAFAAVLRRTLAGCIGPNGLENLTRWLRKQSWYRRWRRVPEGL